MMEKFLFDIACVFDNIGQLFARRAIRLRDERLIEEFPIGCEVRVDYDGRSDDRLDERWFVDFYDDSVGSFKLSQSPDDPTVSAIYADPEDVSRHYDA